MTKEEAIEVINSLTGKDFPQEREASIKRHYQIAEALMMAIEALKAEQDMESAYAHGYTAAEAEFYQWKKAHEQKWVSCSERLPEDGTEVFVYLFERKDPYIAWVEDCRWYTEDFEVEKEYYPIAWMPLPEPYREEQT